MEKKIINVDEDTIHKIISELKEIQDLTPDDAIKFRINNLLSIIEKLSSKNESDSIEEIIYKKMKESVSRNPELNVKLYMLYRSLSDGRISEEKAKEMYETYVQMYPYDTLIY
ncbi:MULTISPECIES: hypothetical protein [Clostridium]|uniref:Uncharacterized protein n=2 Tax=Clostridium TaxID=1485 RepID=A0A151ARU6_9CLOT|nr:MULTISPECIES: hypothetical protein [Clostridium]KYH30300.1 hypothetical protein CLCOL_02460 [Clostridium colicanis DSM 13634]MBE6044477.1 hypothetical protein [Clostridium thermopalmarium]PRR69414.1 hypothetical protein CPAL_25000 [Clostridium thermopalmarium DSM 5974]PVZ26320.1 hypothetical protein LX19_00816 [Clostridium thermopalmarium DSM 5974]